MKAAEKIVGMELAAQTEDIDLLNRIHHATNGTIGHLMSLMRDATHIAREQGKDALDRNILAKAFDQGCPMSLQAKANPFLSSWRKTSSSLEKDTTISRKSAKEKKYLYRKPTRRPIGKEL